MAGAEGFEPSDAGIKIRCVRPLRHAPILIRLSRFYGFPCLASRTDKSHDRYTAIRIVFNYYTKQYPIKGENFSL